MAESDSELESDGDLPPPPKKLKQSTLQFGQACTSRATGHDSPGSEGGVAIVTTTVCTSDCCKGGLTPFQPTEPCVLEKLQRKQGERYRNFFPTWYSTYPWFTICATKGKAFCVYCRYCTEKHLAKKGDDAFVDTGFDNWKKAREKFTVHAQSDVHKEAVLKIELLDQDSVHALITNQAMAEQKVRQQMLLKQLSSLKYLLKQGLAIRGHEDLEGNLLQLLKIALI